MQNALPVRLSEDWSNFSVPDSGKEAGIMQNMDENRPVFQGKRIDTGWWASIKLDAFLEELEKED